MLQAALLGTMLSHCAVSGTSLDVRSRVERVVLLGSGLGWSFEHSTQADVPPQSFQEHTDFDKEGSIIATEIRKAPSSTL